MRPHKKKPLLPILTLTPEDVRRLNDIAAYTNASAPAVASAAIQVLWLILCPFGNSPKRPSRQSPLHISHAVQSSIARLPRHRETT